VTAFFVGIFFFVDSRLFVEEHRVVYEVLEEENKIVILSLKGHY
jgi:Txe/YoeB family toxin of Txe-Axe toxin-antitoxin module